MFPCLGFDSVFHNYESIWMSSESCEVRERNNFFFSCLFLSTFPKTAATGISLQAGLTLQGPGAWTRGHLMDGRWRQTEMEETTSSGKWAEWAVQCVAQRCSPALYSVTLESEFLLQPYTLMFTGLICGTGIAQTVLYCTLLWYLVTSFAQENADNIRACNSLKNYK